MVVRLGTLLLTCLFFITSQVNGQEPEPSVPLDIQLALFSKALKYERRLPTKVSRDTLVIGIIHQANNDQSFKVSREFMSVLSTVYKFGGFHYKFIPLDISHGAELVTAGEVATADLSGLTTTLIVNHVDLLYVTPLRNVDIEAITRISRSMQILTITGNPNYVRAGLSLGIEIKDDKPLFLFNLPAIRAEGASFSSTLLRLGDVIR